MTIPHSSPCADCGCATRLSEMPPGSAGCIRKIDAPDSEAARLKSMGLCVGRNVVVVRAADPMLIKVFGSRLGVSTNLAALVCVERKDPGECHLQAAAGTPS